MDLIVERDFDPPEIEGTGPVAVAASKLFQHQSVIARKDLLHGALVEASLLAVSMTRFGKNCSRTRHAEFLSGLRVRRGRSAGRLRQSQPLNPACSGPPTALMSMIGFGQTRWKQRLPMRRTCLKSRLRLYGSRQIAMASRSANHLLGPEKPF